MFLRTVQSRIALILAIVFSFVLAGLSSRAFAGETAAPPFATLNEREGWTPWTANSIQPPPEILPVKLPPLTPQPGDGETEIIVRNALAWFEGAIADADKLAKPAEAVADCLIAGGKIYGAGSPGFIQEYYNRAGAFPCFDAFYGPKIQTQLKQNDVLLIGQLTPKEECPLDQDLLYLIAGGRWKCPATVVRISSLNYVRDQRIAPKLPQDKWEGRLHLLDTKAPEGNTWSDVSLCQMSTIATAWALHGEIFAAASRKGVTLATYGNDCEPHCVEWDNWMRGKIINDRYKIPKIPAGKIARDYYRTCEKHLVEFLEAKQGEKVRAAAQRLAKTMKDGNAVFIIVSGHVHPQGAIIPREFTRMTMFGRTWQWMPDILKPGDTFFWLGYLDYPKKEIEETLSHGGNVVSLTVDDGPTTEREITIRSFWPHWDTSINIPDYPVRILASSGVIQTPQWYAIMAETEKVYAGK